MGSPLDDLRNISNQVNRKKVESERNIKTIQKKERETLSKKSLDHQHQRKELSKDALKQAKKMKTGVMAILISVVICILFFIIQYVYSSMNVSTGPVALMSDNFIILESGDERYPKLFSFTTKIIKAVNNASKIKADQWYKGLPLQKIERFQKTLKKKISKSGMVIQKIRYNEENQIFEIQTESDNQEKLTLKIIYDTNNKLKIIKVI